MSVEVNRGLPGSPSEGFFGPSLDWRLFTPRVDQRPAHREVRVARPAVFPSHGNQLREEQLGRTVDSSRFGGIEERPSSAYISSNTGDSSFYAASTRFSIRLG